MNDAADSPGDRTEHADVDPARAARRAEPSGPAEPSGSTAPAGAGAPVRRRTPMWDSSTKIVVSIAFGVLVAGAVYLARNVLSLVALSGLIAFLVAPIIKVLQTRLRFPRPMALLSGYVLIFAMILLVGGLVIDGVVGSVSEIDPPAAAKQLRVDAIDWLEGVETVSIAGYEIDLTDAVDPLIDQLKNDDAVDSADSSEDGSGSDASRIVLGRDQVQSLAGGVVTSVRTVGGFLLAALTSALVTFLVAFYLSVDSAKFNRALRTAVPDGYEDEADRLAERFGQIWRGYLYGQLANSLVTGLLVWLALWLLGLPGAFVFGLMMAVLNMIPTFGPIIAAGPGILAALALGSTRLDVSNLVFALIVAAMYVVVVQLQANLMAPLITGRAVQMSPAAILVGLIVGFQVGGLVGSLLVVPVLATLKEASRYTMAKLLDRDPFPDPRSRPRRRRRSGPRRHGCRWSGGDRCSAGRSWRCGHRCRSHRRPRRERLTHRQFGDRDRRVVCWREPTAPAPLEQRDGPHGIRRRARHVPRGVQDVRGAGDGAEPREVGGRRDRRP